MIAMALLLLSDAGPPDPGTKAIPTENFQRLMSVDDYPVKSLREGHQGTVAYSLTIDPVGRVIECKIDKSSGAEELDDTVCRLITARATFYPGHDAQGRPIASTFAGRFTFRIPEALQSTDVDVDFDVSSEGAITNCRAVDRRIGRPIASACDQVRSRPSPFPLGNPVHIHQRSLYEVTPLNVEPIEGQMSQTLQPAAPAAAKSGVPIKGVPTTAFRNLVGWTDYPANARRQGREGVVGYLLSVDATGHVTGCEIQDSSGTSELDEATCHILTARATFRPALDGEGKPRAFKYPGRFTWSLPNNGR